MRWSNNEEEGALERMKICYVIKYRTLHTPKRRPCKYACQPRKTYYAVIMMMWISEPTETGTPKLQEIEDDVYLARRSRMSNIATDKFIVLTFQDSASVLLAFRCVLQFRARSSSFRHRLVRSCRALSAQALSDHLPHAR